MVQPVNTPEALASSSNVAWLCLLTIWTGDGSDAVHVVNNSEAITSRGIEYAPFPFNVTLPADDSETLPQVSLVLSNVDNAIIQFVRGQLVAPNIALELVTSAYPDIVEKSFTFLKLVSVTYDAMTIQGRLDVDNFLAQKFPAESYVPPQFPGLFR
jgi:Domain of unknown function (DUF1833)